MTTWIVIHNPHDYQWPDVYGPFPDGVEAGAFIEAYVLEHSRPEQVLDIDDFMASSLLDPKEYV